MRGRVNSIVRIGVAAALLTGCAHPPAPPGEAPIVRHYTPSEIIVGTRNSGRFEVVDGCIFFGFDRRRWRKPALFPPGSRLSADRRILLPNGQSIAFGERVEIAFEAAPFRPNVDRTCGEDPIEVIERLNKR
jgi:hypothetical protein